MRVHSPQDEAHTQPGTAKTVDHHCPHCAGTLDFDMVLAAVPEQTMTYRIEPLAGSLLSARSVGAQMKAIGSILEMCAKSEGGHNIQAYVAGLSMDAAQAVTIKLLLAEVVKPTTANSVGTKTQSVEVHHETGVKP